MHPSGIQNLLPMPMAMARSGLHVVTCCSRYPNNDSTLIMEKVVCDLGACVRHCRGKLGYKRILLAGWSGGGALVSFYQSQAELGDKALQTTPAGDAVDIKSFVEPVDGLLILAAHVSRARVLTDWMDPSVLDENDPSRRDLELDLYDSRNPNKPPFSADYMERFRTAQVARNRRITSWVREKLKYLEEEAASSSSAVADWRSGRRDIGFVVHCTQADPRRLDISLDPNGRSATSLAELSRENHSPVGLARFCTLRSWLSQWSIDDSAADAPDCLSNVNVPVLVLANGADHLVPLDHAKEMYDAVPHAMKEMIVVDGATHYYFGQQDLMASAVQDIIRWLRKYQMLEQSFQETG
eukprot:TRINITY_DN27001_c0_g1_i4.p1 TRINITY_DN27001_c0_g1~~TRINITY_DN27001_c0_g1_i4.p1  ORF type:complete len:354 (+),score=43.40 TRINITY_DN27001_c0_g1_i4:271-1332(+)